MKVLTSVLLIFFIVLGCSQQEKEQPASQAGSIDTSAVVAGGQEITQAAFKTLSSNLQKAMAEGGVENAVKFCNIEAMPLTDSLSTNFGVDLRRASHRPRNPANQADSLELKSIMLYMKQIEQEAELKPLVYETDQHITYHAPIRINNALCLSCHGQPNSDISDSDLKTITELYPGDQATGFTFGELRGIWSVRFPESYFEDKTTSKMQE